MSVLSGVGAARCLVELAAACERGEGFGEGGEVEGRGNETQLQAAKPARHAGGPTSAAKALKRGLTSKSMLTRLHVTQGMQTKLLPLGAVLGRPLGDGAGGRPAFRVMLDVVHVDSGARHSVAFVGIYTSGQYHPRLEDGWNRVTAAAGVRVGDVALLWRAAADDARTLRVRFGIYAETSPSCVSTIGNAVILPPPSASLSFAARSRRRECK